MAANYREWPVEMAAVLPLLPHAGLQLGDVGAHALVPAHCSRMAAPIPWAGSSATADLEFDDRATAILLGRGQKNPRGWKWLGGSLQSPSRISLQSDGIFPHPLYKQRAPNRRNRSIGPIRNVPEA